MIGFPALRGRSSFLMPPMEPPRSRSDVTFRRAERADVEQIVRLLANDPLEAKRERYELPLPASYLAAFDAIAADRNNEIVIACLGGKWLASCRSRSHRG